MIHLCVTPTYCLFVCESRGVLPQPSISVSPGGVIPVGGNVTIWCWHQHLGLTFLLYKDEDRNYLAHTDTAGSEAEFPITSARREHGGNYTCRYHDKSGIYSEASDPIIVASEGSPKPSIFLRPSEGITLGGAVTVQCQGRHQNMRFLLYKVGNQNLLQDAEPAGDVAEFPIRNVSRRHGGNYHCSYRSKSDRSFTFKANQTSQTERTLVSPHWLTISHTSNSLRHSSSPLSSPVPLVMGVNCYKNQYPRKRKKVLPIPKDQAPDPGQCTNHSLPTNHAVANPLESKI
uniref:Immunoglobulin domain-containing protein n=1 Tax=Chrysemys picta bellii TaxID=8478 RepID=A0A8C3P839_CHRPI